MTKLGERIQIAEELTNTDPTEGQKVGGNYKKGKFIISGLKISIENPKGSIRKGVSKEGVVWSNKMPFTYGYFRGTVGKDGDPIDVYLGPAIDEMFDVYVIDQVEENTRAFDEHKVMFGFKTADEAHKAYLSCFNAGWKGFNNITTLSLNKFKSWLKNKDAIKYPASKLSMSQKINFKNSANPRLKLIELEGEVMENETLANLKLQAGDSSLFDTLMVDIASPGGSVAEGLMIMVWLDKLSQEGKEIITIVSANAYSIASLIMLAADIRLISKHGEVMVHNPMVPELKYANADELEKYASELRDLESVMYELYQVFTGLNREQIKALMDKETYLSPDDAIKYNFADQIIDIQPKSFQMTTNIKKEINMSKTINILNRVICAVNKTGFVNQLYYTEDSGEIEIFQNDPSTYSIGDRTNVKEGEVKLSDGSKLKIEEFMITGIDKSVEETPMEEAVVEEVISEEEVVAPLVETPAPAEPEVIPGKDKNAMPSTVIETTESVKSTKEIIAKADDPVAGEFNTGPAPEAVKEVEAKEVVAKEEVAVEDKKPVAEIIPEPITEPATPEAGPKEDVLAILTALQEGIASLKSQVEQIQGDNTQMKLDIESKFSNMQAFEDLAVEAIDALAGNTTSNFKPEARVVDAPTPTGSIFKQMKAKRGLK